MKKRRTIAVALYRPRCSGWKVFPDGTKCKGCPDCGHKTNRNPYEPK